MVAMASKHTVNQYGLTLKQRVFAEEYLLTFNKRASAIKAGASPRSAATIGGRLYTNVDVSNYISLRLCQIRDELETNYGITKDILLNELAAIAFFDPHKMYDDNGVLLPIQEMDNMTRCAIARYDIKEIVDSDGELIGKVTKIRFHPKLAAIELLGRHLRMWNNKGDAGSFKLNIKIVTDKNPLDYPNSGRVIEDPA